MRLFKDGAEIPLSSKESLLIKYFFNNPNKILSKEQIYRNVWGNDVVDDNTIMVYSAPAGQNRSGRHTTELFEDDSRSGVSVCHLRDRFLIK